jgi:hypothetical protein
MCRGSAGDNFQDVADKFPDVADEFPDVADKFPDVADNSRDVDDSLPSTAEGRAAASTWDGGPRPRRRTRRRHG